MDTDATTNRSPVKSADYRHTRRLGDIGMALFLISLAILFISGLLGYILIRARVFGEGNIGSIQIQLPALFWVSTALIVAASYTIHQATRAIAHERQKQFKQWLVATLVLGGLFVLVQIPCLTLLLERNYHGISQAIPNGRVRNGLYGFIFFLIALHALHVLGGMIALIRLAIHGFKGRYDHENHQSVKHTAQYWHFIDVVWIILFGTILLMG